MAVELTQPQSIDVKYEEEVLRTLSRTQNDGAASLISIRDSTGRITSYESRYKINTEDNGDISGYDVAQANVLSGVKTQLRESIDYDAEQQRLKYITPGAGQAMEYQEAQAESIRALAALATDPNANLTPADYPMLASSVGYDTDPTTGKPTTDIAGEARAVDAARRQFLQIGAAIRDVRLTGKAAVDATNTIQTARDAYAAVKWPTFG